MGYHINHPILSYPILNYTIYTPPHPQVLLISDTSVSSCCPLPPKMLFHSQTTQCRFRFRSLIKNTHTNIRSSRPKTKTKKN